MEGWLDLRVELSKGLAYHTFDLFLLFNRRESRMKEGPEQWLRQDLALLGETLHGRFEVVDIRGYRGSFSGPDVVRVVVHTAESYNPLR